MTDLKVKASYAIFWICMIVGNTWEEKEGWEIRKNWCTFFPNKEKNRFYIIQSGSEKMRLEMKTLLNISDSTGCQEETCLGIK